MALYDKKAPKVLCSKNGNLYLKKIHNPQFEILLKASTHECIYTALDHRFSEENRDLTVIYLSNNDLHIDKIDLFKYNLLLTKK